MHARPTTVLLSLFWSTQRCASAFLENLLDTSTRQDETSQPLLVPDKETSLVNHLQKIRLNPSEIILPAIWNICWVVSTSELSTLSPFNAVAISLVYLYLVQSNPTHTIGLQLNHPCMHCNEVNVFRKLLVSSLGKSTLPIKKVGKCNGGKRAMSAVWNEQADQQLPRPH